MDHLILDQENKIETAMDKNQVEQEYVPKMNKTQFAE